MLLEQIKRTIVSQEEENSEIFAKERMIKRELNQTELLNALNHPNILAILGVRRSGKSLLSISLLRNKKYGYINFDDERIFGLKTSDLDSVLQAFYELYGDIDYLILDEVQNVQGWELFANRLRRTKRVIITGSNSKLLSGELATHLTGRYIDFTLFPFSFSEYIDYEGVRFSEKDFYSTKFAATIGNHLKKYMELGGFPEAHILGNRIIPRIYNDIIEKDIIQKHKIRDSNNFKELAKTLVSSFAKEVTFRRLKEQTKIKNEHTISKYISYLTSAYLIFIVNRFSFKLKDQMKAPKKVYCIDTGIINSVSFQFSENTGRIMESMVAIELMRKMHYLTPSTEIYYWKNLKQEEVDFVVKEGKSVKRLIQVCYDLTDIEVRRREIGALMTASRELKCNDLTIITWNQEGEEQSKGKQIKLIPFWKWLLSKG